MSAQRNAEYLGASRSGGRGQKNWDLPGSFARCSDEGGELFGCRHLQSGALGLGGAHRLGGISFDEPVFYCLAEDRGDHGSSLDAGARGQPLLGHGVEDRPDMSGLYPA